MHDYFSTFISGFQGVIAQALEEKLPDATIKRLLDGLVTYQTSASANQISKLRFFNNSFILIHQINFQNETNPPLLIKQLLKEFDFDSLNSNLDSQNKKFKIVVSQENQFVAVNKNLLTKLETRIQQFTRLRVNPSRPEMEFWLLIRSENLALFGIRITKSVSSRRIMHQGELRPELAHLLCFISQPQIKDVVLDPFCGSGSIIIERAKHFPYTKVYASDQDPRLVKNLKIKLQKFPHLEIKPQNALQLTKIRSNTVNKIITDPPWGMYRKLTNPEKFYTQMLDQFHRVLTKDGLVVILTGAKNEFEIALKKSSHFKLSNTYHILVSGKKAGVYKLNKVPNKALP